MTRANYILMCEELRNRFSILRGAPPERKDALRHIIYGSSYAMFIMGIINSQQRNFIVESSERSIEYLDFNMLFQLGDKPLIKVPWMSSSTPPEDDCEVIIVQNGNVEHANYHKASNTFSEPSGGYTIPVKYYFELKNFEPCVE